jgi:class I fructose-bisphosphate aldolase
MLTVGPRLGRLLGSDNRCVNVAVDHGLFNERVFLTDIEDMPRVVHSIATADPDAIQLTPGLAHLLQTIPGRRRPALVLRTDVANVYGNSLPRVLFSRVLDHAVERAVRLDAAGVVVNLLWLPDQPELHEQCVANVARLRAACDRYAMPLMVEPLVMRPNREGGGYMVDGNLDRIMTLVRQAVELGADVVKADPCDDPSQYHQVIRIACGRPVLVRGGGKVPDIEILTRTWEVMKQGAAGVVYGRNIIQHAHPAGMVRALMAIVHETATPEQALRLLG